VEIENVTWVRFTPRADDAAAGHLAWTRLLGKFIIDDHARDGLVAEEFGLAVAEYACDVLHRRRARTQSPAQR